MVKHKRSNKNFVAIPVEGSLALGTLAFGDVITANIFAGTLTEDLYVISIDLECQITGLTAGEGQPSHLIIAHGDYSDTEINEHLDVKLLGPGNKLEQERARRLVRKVGIFVSAALSSAAIALQMDKTRTKIKFVCQSGKDLSIGVNNRSGAALTTGASLRWSGTVYGRWIL